MKFDLTFEQAVFLVIAAKVTTAYMDDSELSQKVLDAQKSLTEQLIAASPNYH